VLLVRKLLLILASTNNIATIKEPLGQGLLGSAINLVYLVLFEVKRPMLMQPSRLLRGKNLFHMVERAACVASLFGSIIAVLGAASPSFVGVLGVLFALCNLAYATYVMGVFFFEKKKTRSLVGVEEEVDCFKMSVWNSHVRLIDEIELDPADRRQMISEMSLLRTKVLKVVEKDVAMLEGEVEGIDAILAKAGAALAKIRADSVRLEGGEAWRPAFESCAVLKGKASAAGLGSVTDFVDMFAEGNVHQVATELEGGGGGGGATEPLVEDGLGRTSIVATAQVQVVSTTMVVNAVAIPHLGPADFGQ
jgi:hypothetical protein